MIHEGRFIEKVKVSVDSRAIASRLDRPDHPPAKEREDSVSSSSSVKTRPAGARYGPAIAAVLQRLGWFGIDPGEPPAQTESRVTRQLPMCLANVRHAVLVAEDSGGAVAGYVSVHWTPELWGGIDGYGSELFVRAESRGQGVGGALLAAAEAEAVRRGASRLMLFNRRIRESYERRFYQKHGWVERDDVAFLMRYLNEP